MATELTFTPPPLDPEDILQMVVASGLPASGPDYAIWARYITEIYDEIAQGVAEAERDALLNVLQGQPSPEVLRAIEARAASNAKDLITNVTTAELTKIHEQIATATAEGKGPREVARQLDAVKGLDNNRAKSYQNYVDQLEKSGLSDADVERRANAYYEKLLRDRKTTIARTEMRQATSQVQAADAEARGARFKVWQTSGDDRVSDECQANEAQGPIAIDKKFTGGVDMPPQHPNCRCTVSYLTNPALLPEWQARADARAERTAAAKAPADDTVV